MNLHERVEFRLAVTASLTRPVVPLLVSGLVWLLTLKAATSASFSVRDYGALGDGQTLDTAALQKAVDTCAAAGGGRVSLPPGNYLSGTVELRSHMTLFLEAGARLVGTTNLSEYHQPTPPADLPEARWGKWHRALLLGDGVEDVTVAGDGVIDGNRVFDPTGEERMRGPHAILFLNSRRFTLRDFSIQDAANYAILFFVSDDVQVLNLRISGGWDGVHFRGTAARACKNVTISGCHFYTGDDAIAGRYWDRALITGCVVNSACNGLRLIGPATHLTVHDCLFYGPAVQPHRTSNRFNMLSGIIIQPGAWDATEGVVDDVLISGVTMKDVASPVTMWLKPGNTAGTITVDRLSATGVYRSALSVESFASTAFTNVVLRDVSLEFSGGGRPDAAGKAVRPPGVDARTLPAWAVYARNVERLLLENVRVSVAQEDLRPALIAENVQRLGMEGFHYGIGAQGDEARVVTNVTHLELGGAR